MGSLPTALLAGNVWFSRLGEGDVLRLANLRNRPFPPAVLDGINLVEEELAQGVGAVAGFGKAEGWERTNAVVARAVTKAVAEDPLLGAARGDAEM